MTEGELIAVETYLRDVRRGLRGLPPADIDDNIEEMRSHILEETGERGDAAAVLRDFGSSAEVASAIVERIVRPEEGPGVAVASLGRRYSAWATDVVIGFGPMVLVPTALTFSRLATGAFGEPRVSPVWIQISNHIGSAWQRALGYPGLSGLEPISPLQWLLAAGLMGWAAFYWMVLRRTASSSVGMWMTGLRGVRVNDDRIVVRERDIAQKPAPLGAGRNRWWILLAAVPTGCLCILLLVYYVWMCVGAFLPPRAL